MGKEVENGLYWGSGVDTDGLKNDAKIVDMTVRQIVANANKQFSLIKAPSFKVDNSVLQATVKESKAREALIKAEIKQTQNSAKVILLEAQARDKNAAAAIKEAALIEKANKAKAVKGGEDYEAYRQRVINAGNNTSSVSSDQPKQNTQSINEEIAATDNLSSAYKRQQAEKIKTAEVDKQLSASYSENAVRLASLTNQYNANELAIRKSGTATAAQLQTRAQLKASMADTTAALNREIALNKVAAGSLDELKIKLAALRVEYASLSAAQKSTSAGKELAAEIKTTANTVEVETKKISGAASNMGGAVAKGASAAWGGLRKLAYIIPGLGIAGIIGLIVDAIVGLVKSSKLFNSSLTALEQKQKDISTITEKAADDFSKQSTEMAALTMRVKEGGKSFAEKQQILRDYNREFGDSIGKATTYDQAEHMIIQRGPAFIASLAARAKSLAAMALAVEESKKSIIAQAQSPEDALSWMDKITLAVNKRIANSKMSGYQARIEAQRGVDAMISQGIKNKDEALLESTSNMYRYINSSNALIEQSKKEAKGFDFHFAGEDKAKKIKKHLQDEFNDAKALRDLQDEISASGNKFEIQFESNTESESDKINKYFDDLKKKVADFNASPKNRYKINAVSANNDIENKRNYALDLADYSSGTKDLVKELDESKKLYQDYEEFKSKVGTEKADELYASQLGKYKTYLERVQAAYDVLDKKGVNGLNPAERNRYDQLGDILKKENEEQSRKELEWQAKSIEQYAGFQQKKLAINQKYDEEVKRLQKNGDLSLVAGAEQSRKEELKSLQASNSEKLASAEQYTQGIIYLTKKAAKQQVDILNSLLLSDALPEKARAGLQKKADDLSGLIKKPLQQFSNSQIDEEIKKQESALAAVAATGDITSESFNRINNELANLKNLKAENSIKSIDGAIGILNQLTPAFEDLSAALGETDNNTAKQIGGAFLNLAKGGIQLLETFKKIKIDGVSTVEAIGAAASFVASTIASIVSSAQAQKKAYEDFYIQNLSYQHDYNNALLDEIRLRDGIKNSVFFNDYAGKINAGLAAEIKSVKDYREALMSLQDARAITGTKKVRDWGAIVGSTLSGAVTGAIAGAPAGGIGAVPGAVIGGIVGLVGGLLKKRTVVNVYDGLLKTYPKLLDAQGNLNKAMAEAIISSGKIEGSSKENLQYLISMNEQYEAAKEQIDGVISDLAGSLGSDLMGSLFDDWANGGKNAGQAFADGVKKSIANVAKNLLFNAVFGDDFVALQNKIKEGFKTNGDPSSMITALIDFTKTSQVKGQQFEDLLSEFQKQLNEQGIKDVFGLSQSKENNSTTLEKAISGASQEEIGVLAGHTMGMRVAQLETNGYLKSMEQLAFKNLDYALQTATNTYNTVQELKTLNNKVQSGSDLIRAAGGI